MKQLRSSRKATTKTHTPKAKTRLRAVKRKLPDVSRAQLNRAVQAINRWDKRDAWFNFLRHIG